MSFFYAAADEDHDDDYDDCDDYNYSLKDDGEVDDDGDGHDPQGYSGGLSD